MDGTFRVVGRGLEESDSVDEGGAGGINVVFELESRGIAGPETDGGISRC